MLGCIEEEYIGVGPKPRAPWIPFGGIRRVPSLIIGQATQKSLDHNPSLAFMARPLGPGLGRFAAPVLSLP